LQAFGGCGALYASTVRKVETLAFPELGPEALLLLEVEDFPVVVAIDSNGTSVFSR
jgi:fumarate hydratase subunit beta